MILIINSSVILFSGVGIKHGDTSEVGLKTTIFHNGTITTSSKHFIVSTWCAIKHDVKIWPHEKVTCNVKLSVANAFDVRIVPNMNHQPVVKVSDNSQWSIDSVDMTLKDGDVIYTITLNRNESFIDSLFGTPLIFALVMLMCSVFVKESMYRIFLVLLAAVVLIATLLTLTKYVPAFYTPLIGEMEWKFFFL